MNDQLISGSAEVFQALKTLLTPYANVMNITVDTDENYSLTTRVPGPRNSPMFFAAVHRRMAYVSFHLMPVYVRPQLLEGVPPALIARMHGKSCFNFTQISAGQLEQLRALTQRGHALYLSLSFA